MNTPFDAVIIGNGCLGLTLAWEMSRQSPKARLALVGPPSRPGSASMAAGAMINVWAELEAGALEDPALAARADLARRALPLWDRHARELTEASSVSVRPVWGTYVVSGPAGPVSEEHAFSYLVDRLAAEGAEEVECRTARLPFMAPQPSSRAMRVAQVPDGHIDSHAVMSALEVALARHPNCTCVDGTAQGIEIAAQGDKLVHMDDGTVLHGRQVVLANGAYAQGLIDAIPALRASVPRLFFGTGFALDVVFPSSIYLPEDLAGLRQVVRTLDRGGGCGMHLIPGPAGTRRFYFGATSAVSVHAESQPRVHALGALLNGLSAEFHEAFFHAQVAVRAAGHRPVTLDAFPLLGESEVDGIWFCNGTRRDGFTCAPLLARELASALLGGPCDLPEQFKPCRKLISYRTRSEAIERATMATVGGEEMRGLRLPNFRREEWVERERSRITAIYERRQIERFGIHPELLHFYESDALFTTTSHPREWT